MYTKFTAKLALAAILALPIMAQATTYNGNCNLTEKTLSSLTCNGPAKLNRITVTGDLTINGPAKLEYVTVKGKLTVHGPTDVEDTTIVGDTNIYGPLNIEESKFASINVKGPLKADESTIIGKTSVYGGLKSDESTFEKMVFVAANSVKIEQSNLNDGLTILSDQKPVVRVSENSIIKGSVTFQKTAGSVIVKDTTSKVDKVENGTIIKH